MRRFLLGIICLLCASSAFAEEVRIKMSYPSPEGRFKNVTGDEIVLSPQTQAPVNPKLGQVYLAAGPPARLRMWSGGPDWIELSQPGTHQPVTLATITKDGDQAISDASGNLWTYGFSGWTGQTPPNTNIFSDTSIAHGGEFLRVDLSRYGSGTYRVYLSGNLYIDARYINLNNNLYVQVNVDSRRAGICNQAGGVSQEAGKWRPWGSYTMEDETGWDGGTAPLTDTHKWTKYSIVAGDVKFEKPCKSIAEEFRVTATLYKKGTPTPAQIKEVKLVMEGGFTVRVEK